MSANSNTGVFNTIGDWVGLDGQFGSGGSNNSYSLGGLADSFSNLFGGSNPLDSVDYSSNATLNDFNAPMDSNFASGSGTSSSSGGLASMLGNAQSLFNIGSGLYSIYSNKKLTDAALDNYKTQTKIAKANEARTQELYDTFKSDKAALNSSYGSTKVG